MYTKKIYFSGGDFRELQEVFEGVPGVVKVVAGYINSEIVHRCMCVDSDTGRVENFPGIMIEFNPKKMDLSMLMDVLFTITNPYKDKNVGVYYTSGEDEPQIELHLNFIANRGKQPDVSGANLTVNDPNSNPRFARKCYASAGRLKNFVEAEEDLQHYFKKHPEASADIDFVKLKTYLRF